VLFIPNYINEGAPESFVNKGILEGNNSHYIEDGRKEKRYFLK